MKIRPEQIDQLGAAMLERFEDRMVEHLKHYFPNRCKHMGESAVRLDIRKGIQTAAGLGFNNELEVCKYINLMFRFGSDFNLERQPWASVCRQAPGSRAFHQQWDEAYDALLAEDRGKKS